MAQNISLWGASYSNVPAVNLPKTGGGTASFTDITDTTATASDVAEGKYFYTSNGTKTQGTASGDSFTITIGSSHYPDKSFAEIKSAYDSGKELRVIPSMQPPQMNISWIYNPNIAFYYNIYEPGNSEVYGYHYSLNSDETRDLLETVVAYDTSSADATANDVLAGKYFYNENGFGEGTIQTKTSSDLTASGATVSVPSGYYASNASKAVSSGSATPASTISGTSATVSTGTNTLTLSKTVSNTPTVSAGYISSGTSGNSSVSLTANVTTKGTATITPSTSNQTISSGTYLTGTQTISGDANLVAGNIKSGTSIFGVTGTYSGGGSSDVVMGTLTVASNVNTSTSTQITTTSAIGFTPTKFFFWKTERTATSNHVHQASFITIGSSYYVRNMTRYSNNSLSTSGNANNWTTQTAGYLYFNSNTIYFRSSSSYILSAGTWNWVAVK